MGILGFIVFGGIVGWLASLLMHTNGSQGIVLNVVVGVLGSIIGGFAMRLLGGEGVTGWDLRSILVGVLGSVVLIGIVRAFGARHSTT